MASNGRAPVAIVDLATVTAPELMGRVFPEPTWAVPDILAEGVTLLGGRPKLGKSWLSLNLGVAVATGGYALGTIPVEAGAVLYLALEDGDRRLQARLRSVLAGEPAPGNLHIATTWSPLDEGGLEGIEGWARAHPDARLLVVDTLKRVRAKESGNERLYDADYNAIQPLADLARHYHVSILVITHVRKSDANDPLDLISGSIGLTAAADGILVLKRERGRHDATLFVTGRDLPAEQDLALRWDDALTTWTAVGNADEWRLSEERAAILQCLRDAGEHLRPRDIAEALDKPIGTVRKLLWSMTHNGEVQSIGYGKYALIGNGRNGGNPGNAGNGSASVPSVPTITAVPTVTARDRAPPDATQCPHCRRPLDDERACWRCRERRCAGCNEPTGSPFRPRCWPCAYKRHQAGDAQ